MASSEESHRAWESMLAERTNPQPADWEKYAAGQNVERPGGAPDKAGFIQRASEVGVIQAGKEVVQELINGGRPPRSPARGQ